MSQHRCTQAGAGLLAAQTRTTFFNSWSTESGDTTAHLVVSQPRFAFGAHLRAVDDPHFEEKLFEVV
jgi:hypothetical protein